MLTGKRPFPGSTMTSAMHHVLHDTPEPPSKVVANLPAALDAVVLRALARDPAMRFPTAAAFAEAVVAAVPAAPAAGSRPANRQRRAIIGGVAGIAVLGSGLALWFFLGGPWTSAPRPEVKAIPQAEQHLPTKTSPPPEPSLADAVAGLRCSTVRSVVQTTPPHTLLRGIVGSGEPKDALDAIIARMPAGAVRSEVQTFKSSPLSCRLADLVRANGSGDAETAARLLPEDGRTRLADKEDIRLRLQMPGFDGDVRLDDLDSDGRVSHLMELNTQTVPRYRGGETVGLGRNGSPLVGRVSEPFGSDIVVAIVSSKALFAALRPGTEAGLAYVDALDTALEEVRRHGGRLAADAIVLTTSPH
jgi:hypothetical protein